MNRVSTREQILNAVFLFVIQLPLIYRIILFDRAFAFFYIGFLVLLPMSLSRSYLMLIGFVSGLIVDIFSNTPGIHASACVFIMFIRNFWLKVVTDDSDEISNLNVSTLKRSGFVFFMVPLVFVHHFILFTVENGGFHLFNLVISKIFFSTIFSSAIIFLVSFLTGSRRRRI